MLVRAFGAGPGQAARDHAVAELICRLDRPADVAGDPAEDGAVDHRAPSVFESWECGQPALQAR